MTEEKCKGHLSTIFGGIIIGLIVGFILGTMSNGVTVEEDVVDYLDIVEECKFSDGNITIFGCESVNHYVTTISDLIKRDRWYFTIQCTEYDYGTPNEKELKCRPEEW